MGTIMMGFRMYGLGIVEKSMGTTIMGFRMYGLGIVEKSMGTTIMGFRMYGLGIVEKSMGNYYLRADAVPPTPKKRGRRRLTALEVLQAKSAFCRSQRIFLEAGMFLGKI